MALNYPQDLNKKNRYFFEYNYFNFNTKNCTKGVMLASSLWHELNSEDRELFLLIELMIGWTCCVFLGDNNFS